MAEKRPPRSLQTAADRTFWDWCNKSELRLPRCRDCGHMVFPPVAPCENCGSAAHEWEQLSGKATLASWCTIARDYYRGALPLPWDTIFVELAEGAVMIANPHLFTNAEAETGMALKVVFLDCEDEHGAYKLPVFEREA